MIWVRGGSGAYEKGDTSLWVEEEKENEVDESEIVTWDRR